MAPALKQRLVGAIVLVALAVIFVPMLLDGSGRRAGDKVSVEIPEKPEAPDTAFEQGDQAPADAPTSADATTATATDPALEGDKGANNDPATESASTPDSASSESNASTTEDSSANEATDAAVDSAGPASDEASPRAWVVQVGSFGQKTNAVVLRDKLRDGDRDAFIEQAQADSGSVWRVRVGPLTTREEAEKLKKRLDSHRETESLVMSYPD